MNFDFDSLNALAALNDDGLAVAVKIEVAKIDPDPDQVRKDFDDESLEELADSIRERGVLSPISLKRAANGRYIINHGERRWRAARMAGLEKIPAILDEKHDLFDQAIENIQRENLNPLEIAQLIAKGKESGKTGDEIAKILGKSKQWVTDHAGLIDLPECIIALMQADIVVDVTRLRNLKSAHKKHPIEVEAYCAEFSNDFGRDGIRRFVDSLNEELPTSSKIKPTETSQNENSTEKSLAVFERPTNEVKNLEKIEMEHSEDNQVEMIVHVVVDGRGAFLMIDRRPSEAGFFWVKFLDDGEERECLADEIKLDAIFEA